MFIKWPLCERKEKNMKKTHKTIAGIVAALTMFSTVSVSAVEIKTYSEDLSVYYNGIDVYADSQYKPIIVNDRTMVQIKPIFELMGFSSKYDNSLKKATFSKEGEEFEYSFIAEDYNVYKLSAISEHQTVPTTMDVPAMIYNDTFYVPLRAFCETLAMDIDWISAERKVLVTNNIQQETKALSFNNYIGEWGNIQSSYLAQLMDINVKIISVDEEHNSIKLSYKYKMGASGVWEGGQSDYSEELTVSYIEDDEKNILATEPIAVIGYNSDVDSVVDGTQLCRFRLIVSENGHMYYSHGTSTTYSESTICTKTN